MSKSIIETSQAPKPIGPYSQAVKAGNTYYVSGQICIDPATGNLVNTDVVAETHQVMRNIQAILTQAGLQWKHVVKTTIFVKDLSNFGTINEVYGSYFTDSFPARETVEVSRLPKDVQVEISVIAVK